MRLLKKEQVYRFLFCFLECGGGGGGGGDYFSPQQIY